MIRQLFNTMPKDVATVRSKELLVKLKPEEIYLILREIQLNFLNMWYILVVHSVSMWLKHWWKAQAKGGDMETTDREGLSWEEAQCTTDDPIERSN